MDGPYCIRRDSPMAQLSSTGGISPWLSRRVQERCPMDGPYGNRRDSPMAEPSSTGGISPWLSRVARGIPQWPSHAAHE